MNPPRGPSGAKAALSVPRLSWYTGPAGGLPAISSARQKRGKNHNRNHRNLTFGAVALRLLLAMLCGGAVGYGRSRKERPAGLRTYMLICIGAASAVILALYQYEMLTHAWKSVSDEVGMKYDASRLAAQTITGAGTRRGVPRRMEARAQRAL